MTLREKQEKCSRTVILYYGIHNKILTSLVIKPYRLGSKADHDGPRSAVRASKKSAPRFYLENERHWATEKICGKNIKENHAERG